MGVDTKGLLLKNERMTANEVFAILGQIKTSIETLLRSHNEGIPFYRWDKEQYKMPELHVGSVCERYGSFVFYFIYKGDKRMLQVFFGGEGDLFNNDEIPEEYLPSFFEKPSTLWLSLGKWGESTEIMQYVLKDLTEFGKVFYTENDCSGEQWELVE